MSKRTVEEVVAHIKETISWYEAQANSFLFEKAEELVELLEWIEAIDE